MKQSVVNDKQIVDIHIQTGIILRMIFFTVIQQKIRFSYSTASFYRNQTAIPIDVRILKQAKLIKNRREGKSIFYSLADGHVRTIISQGIEHIEEK